MRFRSFLAVLVLAIAGLGFTGCGSSSSSDFVATGGPVDGGPTSGELVFNFSSTSTTVSTPTPFSQRLVISIRRS